MIILDTDVCEWCGSPAEGWALHGDGRKHLSCGQDGCGWDWVRQTPEPISIETAKKIPQSAIEAVAEALNPGLFTLSDHLYGIRFDNDPARRKMDQEAELRVAKAALEAAMPHIRKQIAQEIRNEMPSIASTRGADRIITACLDYAAQIVEGEKE